MKIRSIIQTYILVTLIIIHLLLMFKFFIDFSGFDVSTLAPIYNLATLLAKPLTGTFEPTVADKSILDFSTLLAMVIYAIIAIFMITATRAAVLPNLGERIKHLLSSFFNFVIIIFLIRLCLTFPKTGQSPFTSFETAFTNILVKPLDVILPISFNDLTVLRLEIIIAIVLIGFFSFITSKLVETLGQTKPYGVYPAKVPAGKIHAEKSVRREEKPLITDLSGTREERPLDETTLEAADQGEISTEKPSLPEKLKQGAQRVIENIKRLFRNLFKEDSSQYKTPFGKKVKKGDMEEKSPLEED